MDIYSLKNKKLEPVRPKPFKLEKDIQHLVEGNLQVLFGYELVRSEFQIGSYRIDTLCYDKQSSSFVIIEHKKDKNFSVIDQGFSYLSVVLENRSDLILEYQERLGRTLRRKSVDWTQTKVIFVSSSFSVYQKESINFKDLPIELWEIKQYENNTVSLTQHKSQSTTTSVTEISQKGIIGKVTREVKVYTEDETLRYGSDETKELYDSYKNRIIDLGDDIDVKFRKDYVGFKRNKRTFTDIMVSKKFIKIWFNLTKGELDDPKNICRDVSNIGHWGNGDYEIRITDDENFEHILSLIGQSYNRNK